MSVQGGPGVGKMDRRTHHDRCANPVAFANSSPLSLITPASLFAAFGSDGRFGPGGGDVQEPARRLALIARGPAPWSGTVAGARGGKFTKLRARANHRLRASWVHDRPRGSGAGR